MKLINKKTGEIVDIKLELNESLPDGIRRTIEEAGWKEAKEPKIKNDKIRKFLRAWAEMNGVSDIIVFDQSNSPYIHAGEVVFAENAGSLRVCFRTDEKIDTNKRYTVPELCGEEDGDDLSDEEQRADEY